MHVLNTMKITANTKEVLDALRKNREKHRAIVDEARVGYAKKAREELINQLSKLEKGQISVVTFQLVAPQDRTSVYDTAIRMMEMHTSLTVTLDSSQVRPLMMDEWDWKKGFLMANSNYSGTARAEYGSGDDE
jgi:hypothetical protein